VRGKKITLNRKSLSQMACRLVFDVELFMQRQSFLVAGGGLAGFTAAIEFASAGYSVQLLEQSKHFGGRAATHHQQGFAMNIGPHAFYRAGIMKRQFDSWGIAYSGNVPFTQGASYLLANGARHGFPAGTMGLLRCNYFSLSEKIKIGQIFEAIPKMDAASACGQSMQDWIDSRAGSREAALLLAALTRLSTYAADLTLLDAGAALAQLQLAFSASALYLDGGWESMFGGLVRKAQSLGVEMRIEAGIRKVESGAVELRNGERLTTDGIVLAISPREVKQITGIPLQHSAAARAACLDLGLKRLPDDAASFALGLDSLVYFSVHSLYARGLAPEGGALVQISKYLGCDATATRDELEQVADLAMPSWRREVLMSRFLPDMTVAHAIPQFDRARADVDALGLSRVMIAGDWVGPDGMLADAAVASGLRAARALIQSAVEKAA